MLLSFLNHGEIENTRYIGINTDNLIILLSY